ncbi:MAG: YIP1 family protein [archaeon]
MENFVLTWFNAFVHPKETFAKEKQKASFFIGLIYFLVAFFVFELIEGMKLSLTTSPVLSGVIAVFVWMLVIFFILLAIWQGVLFLLVKLSGRKTKIKEQFYLISLYFTPLLLLFALVRFPLELLGDKMFGILTYFLQFIVFLYSLYLLALALEEVYGYTKPNAFFTGFLSLVITLMLTIVPVIIIVILTSM